MSGMVGVVVIQVRAELDSLLRRVQGMEVCNHASMTTFDPRLQKIEAVHSAKKAATVQVQPWFNHQWKMLLTGRVESTERRQEARMPLRWSMPTGQTDESYSRADLRR